MKAIHILIAILILIAGAGAGGGVARAAATASASAATAAGSPSLDMRLTLLAGHDNEILAELEELGVVVPVASASGTIAAGLAAAWPGLAVAGDRLDLTVSVAGTMFDHEGIGGDTDLGVDALYRAQLARRWFVDARLAALRFDRRAVPLSDLDEVRGGVTLSHAPRAGWLATAEATAARIHFPGRLLAAGSAEIERDRQLDLLLGLSQRIGRGGFWAIAAGRRRTTANDPLVEFAGPLIRLRAGAASERLGDARIELSGAFAERTYDSYPVLDDAGAETGAVRHDRTWQGALSVTRPVGPPWLSLFAVVAGTRQTSTIDAFAFDQMRFQVGVTLSARVAGGRPSPAPLARARRAAATGERTLAPRVVAGGVRFRHRAPAARSVAVVGGFNGWDASRTPLHGPDADGVWEGTVAMPAGIWRYAMVVDGIWVGPQDAPRYEDDGFGGRNGIVEVTAADASGDQP